MNLSAHLYRFSFHCKEGSSGFGVRNSIAPGPDQVSLCGAFPGRRVDALVHTGLSLSAPPPRRPHREEQPSTPPHPTPPPAFRQVRSAPRRRPRSPLHPSPRPSSRGAVPLGPKRPTFHPGDTEVRCSSWSLPKLSGSWVTLPPPAPTLLPPPSQPCLISTEAGAAHQDPDFSWPESELPAGGINHAYFSYALPGAKSRAVSTPPPTSIPPPDRQT